MWIPDSKWTQIELFRCKVRVDLETTRIGYKTRPLLFDKCGCLPCQNLAPQIDDLIPKEVQDELARLGIDHRKPDDATSIRYDDEIRYSLDYIARGRVLKHGHSGEPNFVNVNQNGPPSLNNEFRDRQIDVCFSFMAPWILDEPYPHNDPSRR